MAPAAQPQQNGPQSLAWASVIFAALGTGILLAGTTAQQPTNAVIASSVIPQTRVAPAMPGMIPRAMAPHAGPVYDAAQSSTAISAAEAAVEYDDSDVLYVEEADFETVTAGPVPVLIDYYATWCGPCRLMDPQIAALATEYKGKMRVYKMDCGANGAKCRELGIKMLPTFQLYQEGKLLDEMFGTNKDKLMQIITKALA
uniref:Thioredoxin domain-containing protein n=1 Tax=Eutreptiella gymnastica TaxID=73025 RepID=A0A7S1IZ23_9EUGL